MKRGTDKFESEVCQRFNAAAAVCVPMARTGLFLVLRESIRPGQKVILSPLTIVDVINAVLFAGGIPVFADIERKSCALDIERVDSLIDDSTGAVLLTHLHGEASGAHSFRELCRRRGVPLIEDAAQAFGAIECGKRVGTIGDAGVYSFGFYKNLTTWRGGMIVSNNVALIERIRGHLRELSELPRWRLLAQMLSGLTVDLATCPPIFARLTYPLVRQNYAMINGRLDPERSATRLNKIPSSYLFRMRASQAEIGIRGLQRVDQDARCRINHAAIYHQGFEGLDGVITPEPGTDLSNVYTYFPIQVTNRTQLLAHSQRRGRDFAAQHLRNCADLSFFKEFRRDCPNARRVARDLVLLPTYPRYPEPEVRNNVEVVREFFTK